MSNLRDLSPETFQGLIDDLNNPSISLVGIYAKYNTNQYRLGNFRRDNADLILKRVKLKPRKPRKIEYVEVIPIEVSNCLQKIVGLTSDELDILMLDTQKVKTIIAEYFKMKPDQLLKALISIYRRAEEEASVQFQVLNNEPCPGSHDQLEPVMENDLPPPYQPPSQVEEKDDHHLYYRRGEDIDNEEKSEIPHPSHSHDEDNKTPCLTGEKILKWIDDINLGIDKVTKYVLNVEGSRIVDPKPPDSYFEYLTSKQMIVYARKAAARISETKLLRLERRLSKIKRYIRYSHMIEGALKHAIDLYPDVYNPDLVDMWERNDEFTSIAEPEVDSLEKKIANIKKTLDLEIKSYNKICPIDLRLPHRD